VLVGTGVAGGIKGVFMRVREGGVLGGGVICANWVSSQLFNLELDAILEKEERDWC